MTTINYNNIKKTSKNNHNKLCIKRRKNQRSKKNRRENIKQIRN